MRRVIAATLRPRAQCRCRRYMPHACMLTLCLLFHFFVINCCFVQEDIAREVEHMAKSKTGFEVNFMDVWRMKVCNFLLRFSLRTNPMCSHICDINSRAWWRATKARCSNHRVHRQQFLFATFSSSFYLCCFPYLFRQIFCLFCFMVGFFWSLRCTYV